MKIVKLSGVRVDDKLSFEPHLNLICKKVYLKEKTKSYHEGIYNVAVQLLSFGMYVPQQNIK